VPTSTIISASFRMHARLAAKNLHIDDIPILITPHPVNDLTPPQLREMAEAAYPVILAQLTSQAPLPQNMPIDYVHPAVLAKGWSIAPNAKEPE